jgi:hypothetical protein
VTVTHVDHATKTVAVEPTDGTKKTYHIRDRITQLQRLAARPVLPVTDAVSLTPKAPLK